METQKTITLAYNVSPDRANIILAIFKEYLSWEQNAVG